MADDASILRPLLPEGTLVATGFTSWSPDGKRVSFLGERDPNDAGAHVFVGKPGSDHPTSLAAAYGPVAWSPDGKRLAYGGIDHDLRVMDVSGDNQRQLVKHQKAFDWSPDGRRLVFVSAVGNDEIRVIDSDGGNEQRLTGDAAGKDRPAWSPDGKHIAFSADAADGSANDLVIMDPDGGARHVAAHLRGFTHSLAWSPDSSHIVVDDTGVVVIAAAGGGRRRLTSGVTDSEAVWSPDGQEIAFMGFQGAGGQHLFVVNADGTGQRQLTTGSGTDGHPAWQPRG